MRKYQFLNTHNITEVYIDLSLFPQFHTNKENIVHSNNVNTYLVLSPLLPTRCRGFTERLPSCPVPDQFSTPNPNCSSSFYTSFDIIFHFNLGVPLLLLLPSTFALHTLLGYLPSSILLKWPNHLFFYFRAFKIFNFHPLLEFHFYVFHSRSVAHSYIGHCWDINRFVNSHFCLL